MKRRPKFTPTPWGISKTNNCIIVIEDGAFEVAECFDDDGGGAEDAAHILKCVNAHDDLVAACMAALRTPNVNTTDPHSGETPESLIRMALAKAGHV